MKISRLFSSVNSKIGIGLRLFALMCTFAVVSQPMAAFWSKVKEPRVIASLGAGVTALYASYLPVLTSKKWKTDGQHSLESFFKTYDYFRKRPSFQLKKLTYAGKEINQDEIEGLRKEDQKNVVDIAFETDIYTVHTAVPTLRLVGIVSCALGLYYAFFR